ncbi:hypothetical protein WOLCODRAFT_20921 [Wolfiporia cocos MD-104 SS10]|uniref:Uncharacterized protein n=1 Tax=Wolfiporia cocos (strain MD-104) TaxID=742152 RepID=A0A2H3J605_WOLCO|nr:hypothetical protein WOLCODRAFT_20921 [Wolfiporia cocos MD-104 SS10]
MAFSLVSIVSANLVNVALEGFLYGVFLVLCIASLLILAHRQLYSTGPLNGVKYGIKPLITSPMFIANACLFIANTMHWILSVIRLFGAFEGSVSAEKYFIDTRQPQYVSQVCLEVTCMVIGDALLLVVLELEFLLRDIGSLTLFLSSSPSQVIELRVRIGDTDIVCAVSAALITWRICRSRFAVRRYGGGQRLITVLVVFIESALLLAIWSIFFGTLFEVHSDLASIGQAGIPGITGIASTLITVRVGLSVGPRVPQQLPYSLADGARSRGRLFVRPVEVCVTQVVTQTEDPDIKTVSGDASASGSALFDRMRNIS